MQSPTPQSHRYELIAHINKTKGLDGQLVALERGELSVLHAGLEVWIVPPTLRGVRHTRITEVVETKHKSGVLITLEGVTDRTSAGELVGRYLLAEGDAGESEGTFLSESPRHVPSDSDRNVPSDSSLRQKGTVPICLAFTDEHYGSLGELEEIKEGPAYDIWVVTGPYGRLEIPAVDAYIVHEDEQTVTLDLPKGFIEITRVDTGAPHED